MFRYIIIIIYDIPTPIRVCAAEQGMVFKVLSLNRAYNFTIERQTGCIFGLEAF